MPRDVTFRTFATLAAALAFPPAAGPVRGADAPARAPEKKVLVELYTSQGCDMCPKAVELLGALEGLGVRPDRVVPVAFHVDYFNTPWKDPYSDPAFSRRQYQYSLIHQRENKTDDANSLYFTPMLMVDGRRPMLGSDRPKAREALRKALAEKPGASIKAALKPAKGDPRRKTLSATVAPLAASVEGRELMVGVAVRDDSVANDVPSGENAGKTLVERYPVRSFAFQKFKPDGDRPRTLTFPLELAEGSDPRRSAVAVFVQDWNNGRVYQADDLPWAD